MFSGGAFGQEIEVESYGPARGLYAKDITAVHANIRGVLWVGTSGDGILRFRNGRFEQVRQSWSHTGSNINSICSASDGSILVDSGEGRVRYDGAEWQGGSQSTCIFDDTDLPPAADGLTEIHCALRGSVGDWLVGTDEGLFRIDGLADQPTRLTDAGGLLDVPVLDLEFDHSDNLWIATEGNGLLLRRRSGAAENCFQHQKSTLRSSGGLFFDHREVLRLAPVEGLQHILSTEFAIEEVFQIDSSLALINSTSGTWYTVARDTDVVAMPQLSGKATAYASDRWGQYWVAMDNGVLHRIRVDNGQVRPIQIAAVPEEVTLESIHITGPSELILVGRNSIYRLVDSRVERVSQSSAPISCAAISRDTMVLATDSGEIRYGTPGGQTVRIGGLEEFTRRAVKWLLLDGKRLWFSNDRVIARGIIDFETMRVNNIEVVMQITDAVRLNTHDGSVVVSMPGKICTIGLNTASDNPDKPLVILTDILLADGPLYDSRHGNTTGPFFQQVSIPNLAWRERRITFAWDGVAANPEMLRYSYRLGEEESWSAFSGSTQVQFAALGPGQYAFDVRVCNDRMQCSQLRQPWEFTVAAPIWQKWPFWLVLGVGISLLLIIIIRARERRLRNRAKAKLELMQTRIEALELQQKVSRLQMNPHFIFNALQSIQSGLNAGRVEMAEESIVKFSTLMRSVLRMARQEAISLEDEIEFLQNYVEVERMARSRDVQFIVHIEDEIDTFDSTIPVMLLQPVVENAIQHGGPNIHVHVERSNGMLKVEISDDGNGFDQQSSEGKGVALRVLRERLEALGGSVAVRSSPGKGSFVTLMIPGL